VPPRHHRSIGWRVPPSTTEWISGAAKAATIQAALLRAVIVVESGFNRAPFPEGAIGLMQLRTATARRYGVKNIYDPSERPRRAHI